MADTDVDADVRAALDRAAAEADVVVTSGGVSMGAYDTVKAVLSEVGTVEFLKVAMNPGMPQGHGFVGDEHVPIVTLPGNPVSSYISFENFVRPLLTRPDVALVLQSGSLEELLQRLRVLAGVA